MGGFLIYMNFGKYPYEPYGYQGGYFSKNKQSLAAGLGGMVGLLIRAIGTLIYQLTAGTIKLLYGCFSKACKGISAGWKEGVRTKP